MATVKLDWKKSSTERRGAIHRCEIKARNAGDALFMEVYDSGPWVVRREYNASAYYWLEGGQRRIPLYDDEGLRNLDDAQAALTQWYLDNAPTLLMTLAG